MTEPRRATPDDIDAIVCLYDAYDALELGEAVVEADDVQAMLASDTGEPHVVERDGRVVAFADVVGTGEAETVVDPDLPDRADLQRDLLAWVLHRARERAIPRLEHWAGPRDDGAAVLLTDAGYVHARTLWKMVRPLDGDLPGPVWPAGVRLQPFDPDRDGHTVWDLVQRGFAGEFGSHPRPFEDWALFALGEGKDAVQAIEDDTLIGVATRGVRGGDGHVNQLTVDPSHRGRGLALALLHEVFRLDAAAGRAATTLAVDGENANARRLYEKAGMTVAGEYRRWERDT